MSKRTCHMREGEQSSRIQPFSLRLTKEKRAELEPRAGSMPLTLPNAGLADKVDFHSWLLLKGGRHRNRARIGTDGHRRE